MPAGGIVLAETAPEASSVSDDASAGVVKGGAGEGIRPHETSGRVAAAPAAGARGEAGLPPDWSVPSAVPSGTAPTESGPKGNGTDPRSGPEILVDGGAVRPDGSAPRTPAALSGVPEGEADPSNGHVVRDGGRDLLARLDASSARSADIRPPVGVRPEAAPPSEGQGFGAERSQPAPTAARTEAAVPAGEVETELEGRSEGQSSFPEGRQGLVRPEVAHGVADDTAESLPKPPEAIGKAPVAESRPAGGGGGEISQRIDSQSLHEMVEKTTWSLRNGHQEVRIALKPDHLGHVRMVIAAEEHHVTVRIITDVPAAKDLIEANLHHLRQELEQQGVRVEQLDVLYAGDDHEAPEHRQARERILHRFAKGAAAGQGRGGRTMPQAGGGADAPAARVHAGGIDFFA